jgi:tetratricopeptide (TPR) repeat protein
MLAMIGPLLRLLYELVDFAFGDKAPSISKQDPPEYQQVFESVSEMLAKDSSNIEAYFTRGFVYRSKGLYAQALSDFREVIRLQPDHAHAWLLSSEVLSHLGEYGQAKTARQKARELNPACEHTPIKLLAARM